MKSTYYSYLTLCDEIDKKIALRKSFFKDNKPFLGFKKITEERKKEIEENTLLWRSSQGDTPFPKLFYNVLNEINGKRSSKEPDSFQLKHGDESYLFFILAFDPNLDILRIFLEEETKEEVNRRFKEKFGIPYDDRFRQIEQYYNKRFPDEFKQIR